MVKEQFLTLSDEDGWRGYLPANRSVFGSLEYAKICQSFKNVIPRLYVVESETASICHPMLLRPLADLPFEADIAGKWDATTPDYTGPLLQGADRNLESLYSDLHGAFARDAGIVAEFAHLHPWSGGRDQLGEGCVHNRDIIWVDLGLSPDQLFRNQFDHSCRKNIQKAQVSGVKIFTDTSDFAIDEFFRIYSGTTERHNALGSYFFSLDFFRAFRDEMPENARFVFADHSGKIVAATLYLHDDNDVFSFLGGADSEFNHLRATNLVIWETICWARQAGKKRLILGGGYRPADGIHRFKSTFSKLRQPFYVYKRIALERDYALLNQRCREHNGLRDADASYFPSYRYANS